MVITFAEHQKLSNADSLSDFPQFFLFEIGFCLQNEEEREIFTIESIIPLT
jgi:hypothetical protein